MKTDKGNIRSKGNESDDDQFSKQSWESKVNVPMEFDKSPCDSSEKVFNDEVWNVDRTLKGPGHYSTKVSVDTAMQ